MEVGQAGEYRLVVELEEVESLVAALGVPDLRMRLARLRGRAALAQGDGQLAEEHFKEAVLHLEGVRASLPVDEYRAAYLGDKAVVYSDLVELLLERGREREALAYAERAKSRALLDLLSKDGESHSAAESPARKALERRLQEAREQLNRNLLAAEAEGGVSPHWQEVRASERRITGLTRELERLGSEGDSLGRMLALPDLDQGFASLAEDTVLLEYFGSDEALSAFIVTREGVRAVRGLGSPSLVKGQLERLTFSSSASPKAASTSRSTDPRG